MGAVAESADEYDPERPGAAHAAVVEQLPLLLALLSDDDAKSRRWAAWVVAQCGPEAGVRDDEEFRAAARALLAVLTA